MKKTVILFYGRFEEKQRFAYIPWSMLYLAAHLEQDGYNAVLIDEFLIHDYEHIIRKHAANCVGFGVSAMTGRQISAGLTAAAIFRKYNATAPICWGGAHTSSYAHAVVQDPLADAAFMGQSMLSFPAFLAALKQGEPVAKTVVPSVYPSREQYHACPDFQLDRYDFSAYINPETRMLNYSASIGCPGVCTFCSWGDSHTYRMLPLKRVVDDIEYMVKRYDLTTVLIQDSTFCTDKDFVISFAQEMIRREVNVFWRADSRVVELARFSADEIKLLANSGLDWIFIGIEHTSPRIMKMFQKAYQLEKVDKIVQNCTAVDITIFMSVIAGIPSETVDELLYNVRNVNRWLEMSDKVYCQKCIFTPYPGTPLADMAEKFGYRPPATLLEWANHPLFLDTMRTTHDDRTWLTPEFRAQFGDILSTLATGRERNNTFKPAGTKPRVYA